MSPAAYAVLADLTVLVHLAFVIFVVAGGLVVLRFPRVAWAHLPAAAWGAGIELGGWICPLTHLEVWLRRQAGEAGYGGGFIEQYVVPVLYPGDLTRGMQIAFGVGVVVLNTTIYGWIWRRTGVLGHESATSIGRDKKP